MSKYSGWKTIDELMAGREFGDVRITRADWGSDKWFMPLFADRNGTYYGKLNGGTGASFMPPLDVYLWKLYEEPEQPLYQWARLGQYNTWVSVSLLMTEEMVDKDNSGAQYRKIGGPFYLNSSGE